MLAAFTNPILERFFPSIHHRCVHRITQRSPGTRFYLYHLSCNDVKFVPCYNKRAHKASYYGKVGDISAEPPPYGMVVMDYIDSITADIAQMHKKLPNFLEQVAKILARLQDRGYYVRRSSCTSNIIFTKDDKVMFIRMESLA